MIDDPEHQSLLEKYTLLSRKSLIKVQFSCGGISTGIDEPADIPIVPESYLPNISVNIRLANDEDVVAILQLLKTNDLPVSDLGKGHRIFFVAVTDQRTIGCVAVEIYETVGLLRSVAVKEDFRQNGIGQQLVSQAEKWSSENGLESLFLLTTTASEFFAKRGWQITERNSVPDSIASSSEFASICPTSAICMVKIIDI